MWMVASLKVGYKSIMLTYLLDIFDEEGVYEAASRARARQKAGCHRIAYGGKTHILNAMEILATIWNKDGKYAKIDVIKRCWRKAYILPASWNTDINNEVGSAYLPAHKKHLSNEDCDNICHILKNIWLKASARKTDTNNTAYELQGYFFEDTDTDNLNNR